MERAQGGPSSSHWLLSIHEDSNANATLFRDGEPIFAVAEERLTREKYVGGFPRCSVEACLEYAGIRISDVDVILPANRHHFLPRLAPGMLPEEEHDYFGPRHKAWLYLQAAMARGGPVAWATEQLSRTLLKRRFPKLGALVDHHTAHACSAYYTSGFPECVAVTSDNMGDGFSSKVFSCGDGRAEYLYGSTARHSPGQFYGEIAQLLGFHNLSAGKVTGLAAHGDPRPAYAIMERLFSLNDDHTAFVTPDLLWRSKRRAPYSDLAAMRSADVAAAAQRRLEDVMVAYVRRAVRETGKRDVVLAGGTFANVVVNMKILGLPEVDRIYIHPAMTDQGISMGAGLCHLAAEGRVTNRRLPSVYLGPGYTEEEIGSALDAAEQRWERPECIEQAVAEALADGRVVARFDGRMEYGPRALGNRSILARTDDPSVNDWLNKKLNRTEFMPFAPVTPASHAEESYVGMEGGDLAARYMTITFGVTDIMRHRDPGVVHLDGTARPQIVHEEDAPGYFGILERYRALTDRPSLVNTSFNMHSEPIVCSPDDAVRAFEASQLDVLAIGPFLVRRQP